MSRLILISCLVTVGLVLPVRPHSQLTLTDQGLAAADRPHGAVAVGAREPVGYDHCHAGWNMDARACALCDALVSSIVLPFFVSPEEEQRDMKKTLKGERESSIVIARHRRGIEMEMRASALAHA